MKLFGKKDVYEVPVAQVIDFESDYVMAIVSAPGGGSGGSNSSTINGYTRVFTVSSGDRDF